ncbi:MAG: hypothetical protein MR209_00015 [Veillonellaceae bacterium]|nr:hypothetical protein [Veillonellaceae bacterium]
MSTSTIKVAYCGDAVDSGKMDINLLAPALLALSNLIQESNKILDNQNSKVHVYVHSDFERGSFEINIEVLRTLGDQLQLVFGHGVSIDDVLSTIGIRSLADACAGITSLIAFCKWLRNRKISLLKLEDKSHYQVTSEDGDKTTVTVQVIKLYQSLEIQRKLNEMLIPLDMDGIERFEVREKFTKQTIKQTIESVNKKERGYFTPVDPELSEEEYETTRIIRAYILSAQFEEGLKWKLSDGSNKFWATILDDQFIKGVDEGEISFTNGVSLKIELLEKQTMNKKGELKVDRFVTKVLEYIPRPENLTLPFFVDKESAD